MRPVPRVARLIERSYRRIPPLALDAALAAVVGLVTTASVIVTARNDPSLPLTHYGVALLLAQFIPLVWRHRYPVWVLAIVGTAAMLYGAAKLPDPAAAFAPAVAIYCVGAYRPRRVGLIAMAVVVVAGAITLFVAADSDIADVAVNYFGGVTAFFIGDTVRTQREAAQRASAQRTEDAHRAVADERLRIAREMHDVVAHHLSVIVIQAEAAQEVLDTDPDRAGAAMGTVADTARTALGELRRVLGGLRSEAALGPQPDLASVDDLVASVRQAGLTVDVRTEGAARPVGGVVGLAAYRIVQEALTNVLRHAAARRAEVALAYGDDDLVVTVSDDGRGPAGGDSGGHGLVGMRERVTVLGGSLDAGPGVGGGFAVRARLPLTS